MFFHAVIRALDRWIPPQILAKGFDETLRARVTVALVSLIPVAVAVLMISNQLIGKPFDAVSVGAASIAAATIGLLPILYRSQSTWWVSNALVGILFLATFAATATSGGAAGFPRVMMALIPAFALIVVGRAAGLVWLGMTIAGLASIGIAIELGFDFPRHFSEDALRRMRMIAPIAQVLILFGLVLVYDSTQRRARDILKEAQASARDSERRMKAVFDEVNVGLVLLDDRGKTLAMNPVAERVLPVAVGDAFIERMRAWVHSDDASRLKQHVRASIRGRDVGPIELRIMPPEDDQETESFRRMEWASGSLSSVRGEDGEIDYFIVHLELITQRKLTEQRMHQLAFFDSLTGLANRQHFMQRLDASVERALLRGGPMALLFIDLDGFKAINDDHGHEAGDFVLSEVSERLANSVRLADHADHVGAGVADVEREDLSRLGGDEFTVILSSVRGEEGAAVVAQRILTAIEAPIQWHGVAIEIHASIGIALFPNHGRDSRALLRRADAAMYEEKRNGTEGFRFATPEHPETNRRA